jgi:threonylcarbamoyladenosine tRNA methylthiotransferase MtaB
MLFSIITFGCRVNAAESEKLALELQKKGWKNTSPDRAKIVIINSCAVTQKAERECRQTIYQIKKKNSRVQIVFTGCSATLTKIRNPNIEIRNKTQLQSNRTLLADLIIPNSGKNKLVETIIQNSKIHRLNGQSRHFTANKKIDKFVDSGRLMLKVQDGCDYFCNYCVVPYTRGRSSSLSVSQIMATLSEFCQLTTIKEVVITGINLGLYGKDTQTNLTELVKTILEQTTVPLISFGSIYLENISDDFLNLWKNKDYSKRLTKSFHHFHFYQVGTL